MLQKIIAIYRAYQKKCIEYDELFELRQLTTIYIEYNQKIADNTPSTLQELHNKYN